MDRRNLLNILLIVSIVLFLGSVAYIYINSPAGEEILSVEEVLASSNQYIGSNITVWGFYYHGNNPEGIGIIASSDTMDPLSPVFPESAPSLLVNYSNANKTLVEQTKYYFTGVLTLDESTPIPVGDTVILVADEIVEI
jgi:hypothetical protein